VQNKPPRILNPIPQENIENFKTQFFEEHMLQINELTNTLTNEHLTGHQWQSTCNVLDHLIQSITNKMLINCSAPPLPPFTNRTSQQGGFLPRKLQKQWKAHFSTYHLIGKVIYITKHTPNWTTHPIIEELHTPTGLHFGKT